MRQNWRRRWRCVPKGWTTRARKMPFVAPMSPCEPQPAGRHHTSGGVSMGKAPQTAGGCNACVVRMHKRW
eukprot:363869-Chlamydomonas_euryale.AAC.6